MADPNPYGTYWHAASKAPAPPRGPLTLELDVDVCVVGGGLAGLTVALETARRGWSVAVLEARRIAWSASGANAGVVLPGFDADPRTLIGKVGLDHARTLWTFSQAGADYVRRTARAMPDAGMEEGGWLHASRTGNGKLSDDADLLTNTFGTAAEFWPMERVRTALRSTRYFSGLYVPGAFSIDPLKYAMGLAAAAEAEGARIFEETPVLEIDPAGVRKRITTPSARVRAGQVVLAGNVHIDALRPDLAGTLVPIWAYAIVTEPLGERLRDAIDFGGSVTDTELGDSDHRVVAGDRLMWSDRCTVWQGSPQRHARSLLAEIRRTYPQLGAVKAEYAWTGVLGKTVHGMPQIGELSPGVWLLSGFGGLGINTTAMGGELVARAIVEGNQAWRAFLPFELVWAGGKLGRAVVQTHHWYSRAREGIEAALARRRHGAPSPEPDTDPPPASPAADTEPPAVDADPPAPESADAGPKPRKRRRRKSKQRDKTADDKTADDKTTDDKTTDDAAAPGQPPDGPA